MLDIRTTRGDLDFEFWARQGSYLTLCRLYARNEIYIVTRKAFPKEATAEGKLVSTSTIRKD